MKKNNTPKVNESDKLAQEELLASVIKDFNQARQYIKQTYQDTWSKCFKAYNGIRTDRGYDGVADDFVPEVFSIVEALKANISGTKPKFKYMPLKESQEQDTDVLNALVDYYWSCNNMTEKVLNWVGDMIIYGNGVFMVSWENDKPLIQHIPLSDFFVGPTATHMNKPEEPGYPRYAGYRFLTSIAQLKSEKKIDVDTGKTVPKYNNLDNLTSNSSSDELDKDRKEQYIGTTLGKDASKDQVEVIVYFTQYKKVMIANRDTIIFNEKNPFQKSEEIITKKVVINGETIDSKITIPEIKGFLPFAILRNYVDSNLFFARGDVEVVLPTQEALNDTSSQKRDNLAYALNNMMQIDPRYKHLAPSIVSAPGAIIPIPKNALNVLEKREISPAADTEIARLTQVMRTATAADAAVQGVSQKFSRTTATEVQAQLNQASMRFTTKVQNLEDEGFAQLSRIIYKMIQIFVDTTTAVRMIGNDGITWKDYKPGVYYGEYEPRVVLESTANAENAALSQSMQVAAQFSMNNPLVNQQAFIRKMYETLFPNMSKDDINELLTPPAPAVMGPDGQAIDPALVQGNAQMTPGAVESLSGMGQQGSFGNTARGRATQTGKQGGGGADSSSNNIRRTRAAQPSTALSASSRPVK